jgi:hypothetical protein
MKEAVGVIGTAQHLSCSVRRRHDGDHRADRKRRQPKQEQLDFCHI